MNLKTIAIILHTPEIIISKFRVLLWSFRFSNISRNALIFTPIKITPEFLHIEEGVFINKNCRIEGIAEYEGIKYHPKVYIGNNVSIQQNSHITCAKRIEIGSNTAIAANVTITDIDHPYFDITMSPEKQKLIVRPVKIGCDCKIYNNAVILQGITVGKHCVIGANAVVTKDIPDYSVAVGIPAKVIKRYNFSTQKWERTEPDGSFIRSGSEKMNNQDRV